jgi:hypothetical protein
MKNYVPVTLDQYINESKSITLKRGYKGKSPVVVGASAPIRNQVLSYVAEGQKVSSSDLKRFVAGLNETNANPSAAATMWLRRNGKFFVTESKGGRTFYKLSPLGQRLVNSFSPNVGINEARKSNKKMTKKNLMESNGYQPDSIAKFNRLIELHPEVAADIQNDIAELRRKYPDFDEQLGEVPGKDKYVPELEALLNNYADSYEDSSNRGVFEKKKYDFKDPKTEKPGIVDKESEEELEESAGVSPERRKRIESIIENIKARQKRSLNEAEEEEEEKEEETDDTSADELSFDDLDLEGEDKGSEGGEEAEGDESGEGSEEGEEAEGGEDKGSEDGEEAEGEEEKVEITEFILTVDDVDAAIKELEELGIEANKVPDPEGESEEEGEEAYKENEISVKADDWDELKGWLEEKGVDVEEMFGGEIEVEDVEDEEAPEGGEGEGDDLELDLGGEGEGEGDELELDLGGEGEGEGDELELDLGDEGKPEVEESLTGMENHEKDTNNLIKGAKQVVINYK